MQPEMQPVLPAVGCSCNTVALELATKFCRTAPSTPLLRAQGARGHKCLQNSASLPAFSLQ